MTLKYKHTILLVDDEALVTKSLFRLFHRKGYNVLTAAGGKEGLEILKNNQGTFSLIISDQRMPEMAGAEFLEKTKLLFPDAIRFLVTGYADMNSIIDAINRGQIHRYIAKPWNDDELLIQVEQALEQLELKLENKRLLALTKTQNDKLKEMNQNLARKVEERTEEIQNKNRLLENLNQKLEKSFIDTVRLLSSLIGSLNPKLGDYMTHVGQLSGEIAKEYHLDKKEVEQIEMAGMIHDIGLLGCSDDFFAEDEDNYTEQQHKLYYEHPVIASICLESVEQLEQVRNIILYHNEHYDGTGFPNGLKGDQIPLGSRIIGAISDYCKIVHLWPKNSRHILFKARKYLGPDVKDLNINENATDVLEQTAKKIILLGAQSKYDIDIVTKLLKKLEETSGVIDEQKHYDRKYFKIEFRELKPGMVLAKDLRLNDGRLLLVNGTTLKESSIESIKKFGNYKLIESQMEIYIPALPKDQGEDGLC